MGDKELLILLSEPRTLREGFSALVARYSEPLYWKIRHIVLSHEDANDVLQNTFVKAWQNLGSFRGQSSIGTWLHRIAINEALDLLRKRKATADIRADEVQGVAGRLMADEYFNGDEAQAMLQQAVASLPEVQRTVFTMKYFDDMKYSEISKALNTSEGALKASYHLAVKKITDYFHNHD